ncbi:MAG: sigma 54-interacting transcriptional regulator [Pirellulaceae bacterium]
MDRRFSSGRGANRHDRTQPTNQIVVKDERCSRHHAEIFLSEGQWILRDLDSRNGTMIGEERIIGDRVLAAGEIIRIAHAQLAFVHDLSEAFPETPEGQRQDETVVGQTEDGDVLETNEPTTITHRKGQTKFLSRRDEEDDQAAIPRVGQAAAKLCRIAFELANQPDVNAVSNLALDGLLEGTHANAGAVLLAPTDVANVTSGNDLNLILSKTQDGVKYHRVSNFLATMVMKEGEAVLARNVEGDSTLASRDSHGEIHATSVLCAPIRQDGKVVGLIHLYSTNPDQVPDPDDLEFSLAVADNVALALKTLGRQQELAENLNVTQVEVKQLRKQLGAASEIVGSSPLMMRVQQEVLRAAPSRATVLIRGESGVGKELVARAVHYASPRKKGPFVCLNCAALSETLLESELFGHERGAFTGATDRKMGKFEAADQGTLMLDEIGEMSPQIQAKFLRVLEGHPFERVGGSRAIKVDVRVIAATNRDLEKAVQEGVFRRDLYFRLRVVEIMVPPLLKRAVVVIDIAEHFLKSYVAEIGRKLEGFTPEAREQLQQYRWPGNVRELKNVVERAVVLARGNYVDVEDLNLSNLATVGDSTVMPANLNSYEPLTLAEVERRHIIATLRQTNWNKSRTARTLGIERSTLDRKIRRYGIVEEVGRSN